MVRSEWRPDNEVLSDEQLTKLMSKLPEMIYKSFPVKPATLVISQTASNPRQRDCAVSSLRCLHRFYGFGPDTFSASVNYLDRFLSRVKVQPKYLSCVVGACYFLAGKVHEEEEDIPTATELAHLHRNIWKPSDLKRMEKVILKKLDWDLLRPNCLTFLQHFFEVLCFYQPCMTQKFFENLVYTFEVCINHSSCSVFTPSTLALCIIHMGLEDAGYITPIINCCLLQLQTVCKVPDSELFECHTAISMYVKTYNTQPKKLPQSLPLPKPTTNFKLVTRPSYYGDSDLPTIYEDTSSEYLERDSKEKEIQFHSDDSSSSFVCDYQVPVVSKTNRWSTCILSEMTFNHKTLGMCSVGKS